METSNPLENNETEFSSTFESHARLFTAKQNPPWHSLGMIFIACLLVFGFMVSQGSSALVSLIIPLGVAVIGVPIALADSVKAKRLAKQGILVNAILVQANDSLYHPSNSGGGAPALVVFSFEDIPYKNLGALVERAHMYRQSGGTTAAEKKLGAILRDERYIQYRRVTVPQELTEGAVVYMADLWINRKALPQGYLQTNQLICIATPGARGWLLLIPPMSG